MSPEIMKTASVPCPQTERRGFLYVCELASSALEFLSDPDRGRLVSSKRRTGDASPLRAAFEYKPRQILLFAAADMAIYFFVAVVVMPGAGNHKRGRSGRVTGNSTRAPRQPLVHASRRGFRLPVQFCERCGSHCPVLPRF